MGTEKGIVYDDAVPVQDKNSIAAGDLRSAGPAGPCRTYRMTGPVFWCRREARDRPPVVHLGWPRHGHPSRFTLTRAALANLGLKRGDYLRMGYDTERQSVVVLPADPKTPKNERWLIGGSKAATPGVASREVEAFLIEHGVAYGYDYPLRVEGGIGYVDTTAGKQANPRKTAA